MTTMTTTEVAEATARPILELGRAWMLAPSTGARGADLGLADAGPFGFWVNGRAGVLGEVAAEVAAAAIGFMAPDAVRRYWRARPDSLPAWEAAVAWFDCGAVWARHALAAMPEPDLRRLADLARAVIDGADLSTGMLFAGSTLIPTPGDAAGDVAVTLNVLRELRGGAHIAACHAAGLGPHATIMSTDDPIRAGSGWAERFGWTAPHPQGDPAARAHIEQMTTAATARAYESLTPADRAEFAGLVNAARAHIGD